MAQQMSWQTRSSHTKRPSARSSVGQRCIVKAGLFGFLTPQQAAPTNTKAKEIVEQLVEICSKTDAGLKANNETKKKIDELVSELQPLCIKNPLKSKLLWGTYEVLYASKPTAVGGPLKSGAGPLLYSGQVAKQLLLEPNQLVNQVEFQTLGFLKGRSRQFGEIKPISGDTFVLSIQRGEIKTGLNTIEKEFNIQRRIQIAYLDDTLRVARFLPTEGLVDDESGENKSEEEILFVFKRVADELQMDEEEVKAEAPAARSALKFFGSTPKEGLATQAERSARSAKVVARAKAPQAPAQRPAPAARPAPAVMRKTVQEDPATQRANAQREREKAAEQARQERERAAQAAAQARAQAAAEAKRAAEEKREAELRAKEKAEAERAAARERQEAIRNMLLELSNELKEAQTENKDTTKALRDAERASTSVVKTGAAAREKLGAAEKELVELEAALVEARAAKREADQEAGKVASELREQEKKLKQPMLSMK